LLSFFCSQAIITFLEGTNPRYKTYKEDKSLCDYHTLLVSKGQ